MGRLTVSRIGMNFHEFEENCHEFEIFFLMNLKKTFMNLKKTVINLKKNFHEFEENIHPWRGGELP